MSEKGVVHLVSVFVTVFILFVIFFVLFDGFRWIGNLLSGGKSEQIEKTAVIPTANPNLKPEFSNNGTLTKIDSENKILEISVKDSQILIVYVDDRTKYQILPNPGFTKGGIKNFSFQDLKEGDIVRVVAQNNYAGNSILKAQYINIYEADFQKNRTGNSGEAKP